MTRRPQPAAMALAPLRKTRCAVYTRKSTDEGLEKEFNSLDAQRESCEAYIASQRAEGWLLVPDRYDDGGVSGGTLERPALQRLLRDIEAGRVDVIVVYKIDRLSRSLMHFAKLVEVFDANNVTFVSVTQSFNTTTSMGRLTLNILLSFAQFEREVIGERIRDKVAASKARGMWMGGSLPLGYDVRDRKLVVNDAEAKSARRVFAGFVETGSATKLVPLLRVEGVLTKTGRPFDKGAIYKLLNNRTLIGEVTHKDNIYPGEHAAIVPRALWDEVHEMMQVSPRTRANQNRRQSPALLRGLIFGPDGRALSPTHTRKEGEAVLLLREPGGPQRDGRRLPGPAHRRGGDRGGGDGPGPGAAPAAGGHHRHVARGAGGDRRPDRGSDAGGAGAARPVVGRIVPRRTGAHHPAAGRTRRRQPHWRGYPASGCGSVQPGAGSKCRRDRPAVRGMSAATSITVRVPITIRKRGGRRLVVAPEGRGAGRRRGRASTAR